MAPVLFLVALVAVDAGVRLWRSRTAGPGGTAMATSATLRILDIPVPLQPFTATDLDGQVVSSSDWQGRFALLNVWATWCVPCRAEIPDLVTLQRTHRDRLHVVGILQDQVSAHTARQFVRTLGVNYPVLFSTWDVENALGETLVLPTSYLVNPAGLIVATHIGRLDPALIGELIAAR